MMQLRRARVKNLHGLFTKTVRFYEDFTFIHGINGTGKTSILRAIQALSSPDLDWIISNEYEFVEIWIEDDGAKIRFRCERAPNEIAFKLRIGNESTEERFSTESLQYIIRDQSRKYIGQPDTDDDVIESAIYETFSQSSIIRYIQGLPTPTFLGLARTANLDSRRVQVGDRRFRTNRRRLALADNALSQGIIEATDLVQSVAREAAKQRAELEKQLRTDITFLMFSQSFTNPNRSAALPTAKDLVRYRKMRNDIISTLSDIGFERDQINAKVAPFFDSLIGNARYLSQYESLNQAFEAEHSGKNSAQLITWIEQRPILATIIRYSELVEQFNQAVGRIRSNIDRYEGLLKQFFNDSNKNILVSDTGILYVLRSDKPISLDQLSSGEKQIFVLLTHLLFNPALQQANVLIIDEPELSLHVKWQEIFVESVRKANPRTQLVLATHSPSIVLDRRDRMVDLNAS